VLGIAAILIVVQVAQRFPRILRIERYVTVRMPEFSGVQREATERSDLRAGDARRILKDATQPLETRLRVLVALQSMEPKAAVPLLISLLSDPSEDIRLLAYSMVDSWEKDLVQKIQRANAELVQARESGNNTLVVNALRRLAELHWTQADTGLARGDLRRFALEHAQKYCEQVQSLDNRAPGIWALYARILTELGHLDAAVQAVRMARRLRMPKAEAFSLMARIAYAKGNYAAVRRYASLLPDDGLLPASVMRTAAFWSSRRPVKKVDLRLR
jgi:polysaccharide biosynthesis protein PelE